MKRPIGGMILGVLAALAGLWQIYLMLVFAGIVKFTFLGPGGRRSRASSGASSSGPAS